MRHVTVDSYGTCLKTASWDLKTYGRRGNGTAFREFLSKYKFYLAFENSMCEDYVTEKYWRALQLGVVPIVLGAPNILDFEPTPHSILKVSDFASPKALADYVKMLDSNDTLYNQYLSYKRPPPGGVAEESVTEAFAALFERERGACSLANAVAQWRGHPTRPTPDRTCAPSHPCATWRRADLP
eukprot:TRINITY_DN3400_c0_g1_i1.p1 TRINITY_DN3400_c0_g1~~TRINITY_DN3400_c0_g1_i1.p1  ORF type:complete len:184 (-),score=38.36 TRINITY_DN3400_c0_g1_i1:73-624(-)